MGENVGRRREMRGLLKPRTRALRDLLLERNCLRSGSLAEWAQAGLSAGLSGPWTRIGQCERVFSSLQTYEGGIEEEAFQVSN